MCLDLGSICFDVVVFRSYRTSLPVLDCFLDSECRVYDQRKEVFGQCMRCAGVGITSIMCKSSIRFVIIPKMRYSNENTN